MTSVQSENLVHSGLLRWAETAPNRVALYADGNTISFSGLADRCMRIAGEINRREAQRVGLCLPNSSAVIEVFFATVMASGCICVFDPTWPPSLLQSLFEDQAPNLLVAPRTVIDAISPALAHGDGLTPHDIDVLAGGEGDPPVLKSKPTAEMPFLIGFTSGSSGKPKGFIRSHRTWTESFRRSAFELGTRAGDVVVVPGPLSHGLSLYAAVEALTAGASVVIQASFDDTEVLNAIAETQTTTLVVVPAMLDVLLDCAGTQSLPSVKRIITAGAKLLPALRKNVARIFPQAETIEYYGASELSFVTVAKSSERCPLASVGRAFSGVDIALRDDDGVQVDTGQVGTVWVKSAMMSSGYAGPTDGSGFRTDGDWATVGDLGHFDDRGFLYLDGREGSTITTAGYTVYPSAIETALLNHPDVTDAAVIGVPDPRWGEVIAAAVVLQERSVADEQGLTDHCRALLEPYACPRQWRFVARLARTPSGKTRRADLLALFV